MVEIRRIKQPSNKLLSWLRRPKIRFQTALASIYFIIMLCAGFQLGFWVTKIKNAAVTVVVEKENRVVVGVASIVTSPDIRVPVPVFVPEEPGKPKGRKEKIVTIVNNDNDAEIRLIVDDLAQWMSAPIPKMLIDGERNSDFLRFSENELDLRRCNILLEAIGKLYSDIQKKIGTNKMDGLLVETGFDEKMVETTLTLLEEIVANSSPEFRKAAQEEVEHAIIQQEKRKRRKEGHIIKWKAEEEVDYEAKYREERKLEKRLFDDIRDAKDYKELPSHCGGQESSVNKIVFRGERHSGTKLIVNVFEQNLHSRFEIRDDDPTFGWKHGFLPPLGWGERLPVDEALLIVITRDVFTWLPKMYREPYDTPSTIRYRRMSFSEFLRADYQNRCHPTKGEALMNWDERRDRQEGFCSKLVDENEVFDSQTSTTETAENIIQIRTQKYKQWVSDELDERTYIGSKDEFRNNRFVLRLESLTPDLDPDPNIVDENENQSKKDEAATELQDEILGSMLDGHCVKRLKDFEGVLKHIETEGRGRGGRSGQERRRGRGMGRGGFRNGRGLTHGRGRDLHREGTDLLKIYTKEDIMFVFQHLDLELERKLGYDYDYILDMLDN